MNDTVRDKWASSKDVLQRKKRSWYLHSDASHWCNNAFDITSIRQGTFRSQYFIDGNSGFIFHFNQDSLFMTLILLNRAVFTWLSKGIAFGFCFGFTTPFGWLVYLLWFWFYDSQVKTALLSETNLFLLLSKSRMSIDYVNSAVTWINWP